MQIPTYLINEHYDDRYFDVVNAIEEAKQVFFQGCGLLEMLSSRPLRERTLSIGETGFGAGRMLIALLDYLNNDTVSDAVISYNSVELHPITSERMAAILEGFRPAVGHLIDLLADAYGRLDILSPGWKQLQLVQPFGSLTLNLWIGEALEMVRTLPAPCDAWFLDGHGPKKNPAMWRPELLMEIGAKTVTGGTCATYTVAGEVRRGLAAAGFAVEQCPGYGGKKAVLKGVKLGNDA